MFLKKKKKKIYNKKRFLMKNVMKNNINIIITKRNNYINQRLEIFGILTGREHTIILRFKSDNLTSRECIGSL